MREVHTWTGLVLGLVVYGMFFFGVVALYRDPLSRWEDPRQQRVGAVAGVDEAFALARRSVPPHVERWTLELPSPGSIAYGLRYHDAEAGEWRWFSLDPARDRVSPRDVHVSRFLFGLHFLWHDAAPALYYVGGLVAAGLLLAIVSGVVFHARQLVPQLGRFRPRERARVLITDLHKVLGVLGLPFQLVFAFTGAFFVLAPMLLDLLVEPVFHGDEERARQLVYGAPEDVEGSARGGGASLSERIRSARRWVPGLVPEGVHVGDEGSDDAHVEIEGRVVGAFAGSGSVAFRDRDGRVLDRRSPRLDGAASTMHRVIVGLHYASYGGATLRALYALLALATAATAISGNLVWIARRDSRASRWLRALTEGVASGAFVATAAMLLAARLVPFAHPVRHGIEEGAFFGAWALVLVDAALARDPRAGLVRHLALAGALFVSLPLVGALTSENGLASFDLRGVVARVDLALLVLGALLLAAGARVARAAAPAGVDPSRAPSLPETSHA